MPDMKTNGRNVLPDRPLRRRGGTPRVTLSAIGRFARQLGERFRPDRIILFGSYAWGRPNEDSDVDLLIVMPAASETNQAIRMRLALDAPFPLDLIVRTPEHLQESLVQENWFLREIVSNGKVLYEKGDETLDSQSRGRSSRCKAPRKLPADAS
jgi:predicted nucleotidyltransferase